jgi:Zn-dependent peptidase ImmA (M78 family)
VHALSDSIGRLLGLSRRELRAQKDAESAFALLRARAEQAGVFVLLVGHLGSHHSAIPVEAFRGFAIADPIAPFIVINDGDAKAAWSFTLLHELAHLFLGATGVSAGTPELQIERFCNDVASEFLVPRSDIETLEVAHLAMEQQLLVIAEAASRWRVSRQLVAYGLYKAGRLSLDTWKALDGRIRESWMTQRRQDKEAARLKKTSGPTYYIVRRHRLGAAMLDFAHRHLDAGTLSPVKAARVLGVKPRSVYPLLMSA